MFRDKKRSISNPSVYKSNSTTSPSSYTVTTKPLLNNQSPNVSLSSAAAAAALRSQPASRISVADVTTKRMLRNKSSISPIESQGYAFRESHTIRRKSFGSISQRSFRDSSSISSRVPNNTPPIPPLPDVIKQRNSEIKVPATTIEALQEQKVQNRNSSLETEWLIGSASGLNTSNQPNPKLSISKRSINFSLPTDSRPNSPIAQRRFNSLMISNPTDVYSSNNQKMMYDSNSRRFIPEIGTFVSRGFFDNSDKTRIKRNSFTQSEDTRISLAADRSLENKLKDAKTAANWKTASEITSSSPEDPSMTKTGFFSTLDNVLPSKYENIEDRTDTKKNDGFQFLKPFDFERPSNEYPIDKDRFDLAQKNGMQSLSTSADIVENLTAKSHTPKARILLPSPPFPFRTEHTEGQDSDSIVFSGNQNLKTKHQSILNHVDQKYDENALIIFNHHENQIMKKPPIATLKTQFPANLASPHTLNSLEPSNNYPRKSALKDIGSSLNFSCGENIDEVSKDESHLKKINRVSFYEKYATMEGKAPIDNALSEVIGAPKKPHWLNFSLGKTKDGTFTTRENQVLKPRPRLPSFGSVRGKKKRPEAGESCLVKPEEVVDYNLSPVSPGLHINLNLEISENKKNKLNDNTVISELAGDDNLENLSNALISKGQLSSHVRSTQKQKHVLEALDNTKSAPQGQQDSRKASIGNFDRLSEERELLCKKPSRLTGDTSETHLTFSERPTSSNTRSPDHAVKHVSSSMREQFERLHIPGAWESPTEEFYRSLESDLGSDIDTAKIIDQISSRLSVSAFTTLFSRKVNTDSLQASRLGGEYPVSNDTSENPYSQDDSEEESIYCDAAETIPVVDDFSLNPLNPVIVDSIVNEDEVNTQSTTASPFDRLLVSSQCDKKYDDGISLKPLRREESKDIESSLKQARLTFRESKFRSSLRGPRKTEKAKFKTSTIRSGHLNTRSSSPALMSNTHKMSKFHFSRFRNRHSVGLSTNGKVIKTSNHLFNTSHYQDLSHPAFQSTFIDSIEDDHKNIKSLNTERCCYIRKDSAVQNHSSSNRLDTPSNRNVDPNKLADSSVFVPLPNQTGGPVTCKSVEENITCVSTPNLVRRTSSKPKENLISIIRQKKVDIDEKAFIQNEGEMIMPCIGNLNPQFLHTKKKPNNSFNSPKKGAEKITSLPLSTSESITTHIRKTRTACICENESQAEKDTHLSNNYHFSDSDMTPKTAGVLICPNNLRKKKLGQLRRIFRLDG